MSRSRLARFNRREFFGERWHYSHREQVFICQPTQGGKTQFGWELLSATPHIKPPVALVMKPRDPTPARMTQRFGWKEIQGWPPPQRWPWQAQPPGYTLWPKHSLSMDPASIERTNAHIKAQFERCMMDTYRKGDRVIFVDEIFGLLSELAMQQVISALSNRGAGMQAPIWYASQKGSGTTGAPMPGYLFNNPRHLFFGYDSVAGNRKRFSEISGVNTALVMEEVSGLQPVPMRNGAETSYISPLLYVNKNGPDGGWMCIVEPW